MSASFSLNKFYKKSQFLSTDQVLIKLLIWFFVLLQTFSAQGQINRPGQSGHPDQTQNNLQATQDSSNEDLGARFLLYDPENELKKLLTTKQANPVNFLAGSQELENRPDLNYFERVAEIYKEIDKLKTGYHKELTGAIIQFIQYLEIGEMANFSETPWAGKQLRKIKSQREKFVYIRNQLSGNKDAAEYFIYFLKGRADIREKLNGYLSKLTLLVNTIINSQLVAMRDLVNQVAKYEPIGFAKLQLTANAHSENNRAGGQNYRVSISATRGNQTYGDYIGSTLVITSTEISHQLKQRKLIMDSLGQARESYHTELNEKGEYVGDIKVVLSPFLMPEVVEMPLRDLDLEIKQLMESGFSISLRKLMEANVRTEEDLNKQLQAWKKKVKFGPNDSLTVVDHSKWEFDHQSARSAFESTPDAKQKEFESSYGIREIIRRIRIKAVDRALSYIKPLQRMAADAQSKSAKYPIVVTIRRLTDKSQIVGSSNFGPRFFGPMVADSPSSFQEYWSKLNAIEARALEAKTQVSPLRSCRGLLSL